MSRKSSGKTPPPKTRPPRLALVNLGCAKNTVDSEQALGDLLGTGWTLAADPDDADLVLVNTCAFVEDARAESREVLADLLGERDDEGWPKVAAMGCFSQRAGAELADAFPALDGILPFAAYDDLPGFCQRILGGERVLLDARAETAPPREAPRLLVTPPSYAYLRISEGCDNRCAYCAIPLIRGPMRSRPAGAVADEAKSLGEMGVKELVLVAQDTTRYGLDRPGSPDLAGLLDQLLAVTDAPRIRILYAHPAHLDDAVIDRLAGEPRLCRYLDLPVQHVADPVLDAMGRGYGRGRLLERIARLREAVPDLTLRTTALVGFPGETDADFEALLDFVRAGNAQYLGAFTYSPEPGTPAAEREGRVPEAVARERLDRLLAAQQAVTFAWMDTRLGGTETVLVDQPAPEGGWEGRTVREAPEVDGAILLGEGDFSPGDLIPACLTRRDGYDICANPHPATS